ncbi:unnamed protein product [Pseudo-nitzschia multistriata]|uniref:Uncharacterized protein n=1 Tax=Pseudo-nitzschia multistriata TaxID=183589 RepID=A0A448ZN47_9STRA|nr:unnamed protein product [Pseudo-nitzschia multistriata]
MFMKSAASDTDQGKAIQSINEKWGEIGSNGRPWGGRETIGIQVCKKKYSPFLFTIDTLNGDENDANAINDNSTTSSSEKRRTVRVVRMFGCPHHSHLRKEKIERNGIRNGWEPFGQWSLQKALLLARNATIQLNKNDEAGNECDDRDKQISGFASDGNGAVSKKVGMGSRRKNNCLAIEELKSICHNGKCLWKKRNKYDDIFDEITRQAGFSCEEETSGRSTFSS